MKSCPQLYTILSLLITTPALASETLQRENARKAFSSPDIAVAVEAAQRFPTQTEYVGYEWYNRSTSKSFSLPKMLNAEMNELVVEGAMGPTAAGIAAADEATRPVRRVALGQNNEDDETIETDENLQPSPRADVKREREIFIREARSVSETGEIIIRDIRSVGTVSASTR